MGNVERIKVGEIEVLALRDGGMRVPSDLFPDFDPDRAMRAALQAGIPYDGGDVDIPVNAYVVRRGATVVVVDTGCPPDFGEGTGGFLLALAEAGIDPGDVTHVVMTHLHIDHVGGLVDAQGQAIFPKAELITGAGDWDYFHSDAVYSQAIESRRKALIVTRRAVAPYVDRWQEVSGETALMSGLTSVPLPGHTPGHHGLLIDDGIEQLLIWGDIVHAETLQLAEPTWGIQFDVDMAQARETRLKLFDRVANDGVLVAGMHVRFPGFSRLERANSGYRLIHAE